MLTIEAALERILTTVCPFSAAPIPLAEALGLTLAENVLSDVDLPPFDKSLMDGFAVRSADVATGLATLRIVDQITAGSVPMRKIGPGETSQIMTGAVLPAGADAVVRIEDCEPSGDTVRIATQPVSPEHSILRRATNRRRGEMVVSAGVKLGLTHIGALAEVGCVHVSVRRRPQIAVLATGNELVPVNEAPGPGQIRNSNESMLIAQIQAAGGVPVPLGIARDTRDELREKIQFGLQADVLVLSGGVSAGTLDLVPSELAAAGVQQVFHKIEMKPGKPLWFGEFQAVDRRCYVFGLPGNPVSSLICFEAFVRPALRQLMAESPAVQPAIPARLQHSHHQSGDRPTFHPARLTWTHSGPEVALVPWRGSSDLQALVAANAMAFVSGETRSYQIGESLPTTAWG